MSNKALTILAGVFLSLSSAGASHAANIHDDTKARQGVVRCGGNNDLRAGRNGYPIYCFYPEEFEFDNADYRRAIDVLRRNGKRD